ncbi:MAG TPA: rhodanese-like domain-containing protein [Candidatus Baltobacteraceae bacterium]|jgi:rhodanese-related sulfurtransferase
MEISVEELGRWRDERKDFVLLDVREPAEIAAARIDGATLMPMREVFARLNELDKAAHIAVLCHHGGRSATIAALLAMQGFPSVYNVEGGINAYALRVDPTIPTYD